MKEQSTEEAAAAELLERGCSQLGMTLSAAQRQQFAAHARLLMRWNRTYNLTTRIRPEEICVHHFLDSLSILRFIQGNRILDLGSGAGFPGVPLAILLPDRSFTLLDGNGKRCRFLTQVRIELDLPRVEVVHARAEGSIGPFDQVLARAYGPLERILLDAGHLLAPEGQVLAMKGDFDHRELEPVEQAGWLWTLEPLAVPYLAEQRQLVTLRRM